MGQVHVIEFDKKCDHCKGSGIYVGMAERNGAGVVCHTCEGKGHHSVKITYEDFEGKTILDKVVRVYEADPGICIGENRERNLTLEDFGGMDYKDWLCGKPFPEKSENRKHTCPAWWYQSADYTKKPDWEECWKSLGSSFSKCSYFENKEKCWERFDKENKK